MRLTDGIGRRLVLGNQYAMQLFDKLHQLEDIEEELGIELTLYFKIYKRCLKNKPIYYIKNNQIVKSSPRVECCLGAVAEYVGDYGADNYDFRDYGKTWALTKEELK